MKKILFALGAVVLLGAGCAVYQKQQNASVEKKDVSETTGPKRVIVQMVPGGFNPSQVEVDAGTTVVFENKDTVPRWPASGVHPTHELCPGFDAEGSVAPGSFYTHLFIEKKECPFHDHLYPQMRGMMRVK